jgi:hypothetical protein
MERVQLNGADIEHDVRGSGAPVVFIYGAILSDGFVPVIEQTGTRRIFRSSITGAAATPVAHALWRA